MQTQKVRLQCSWLRARILRCLRGSLTASQCCADLGLVYDWMKTLYEVLQVNVMGYDYTGYGHSAGIPSEADCYADIVAAFSYLMQEKNLLPTDVILYGRSIGSGPTVEERAASLAAS